MSEFGFFHPLRGYWQAIGGTPSELLSDYPEGTIQVPIRPGIDHEFVSGEWAYIPPSLSDQKAAKLAAVATQRWEVETGGITVGGAAIATDRVSQSLINGAYNGAIRHPATIIKFKSVDGWVTLDAVTMITIGDAVFFHVQACFAHEEVLATAIDAAPNEAALNAIDINAGWPA
ncbi:DUF4376 domain-containing protein [Aminobacter niigataensis]|uniref:DUF4376 domain-containing protein n=1 Tax=Aminobacter niigataensis TaxID=83265 RepID=UPI0024C5A69D|nr:DUF4376 domain-containing protein [Aminobacter niigataensis]CAI2936167.1 conserved protein of unknown function [Aminobacter niigataensis]